MERKVIMAALPSETSMQKYASSMFNTEKLKKVCSSKVIFSICSKICIL
jgi:hypothetical protein